MNSFTGILVLCLAASTFAAEFIIDGGDRFQQDSDHIANKDLNLWEDAVSQNDNLTQAALVRNVINGPLGQAEVAIAGREAILTPALKGLKMVAGSRLPSFVRNRLVNAAANVMSTHDKDTEIVFHRLDAIRRWSEKRLTSSISNAVELGKIQQDATEARDAVKEYGKTVKAAVMGVRQATEDKNANQEVVKGLAETAVKVHEDQSKNVINKLDQLNQDLTGLERKLMGTDHQ